MVTKKPICNCELCGDKEAEATITKDNMLMFVCKSCGLKCVNKGFSYQEIIGEDD